MLLTLTLPLVNKRFIPILKTVQEILPITKERVCASPCLVTEPSEYPAVLILYDHDSCVILSAILKESDQAAAILVKVEDALPLTLAVK